MPFPRFRSFPKARAFFGPEEAGGSGREPFPCRPRVPTGAEAPIFPFGRFGAGANARSSPPGAPSEKASLPRTDRLRDFGGRGASSRFRLPPQGHRIRRQAFAPAPSSQPGPGANSDPSATGPSPKSKLSSVDPFRDFVPERAPILPPPDLHRRASPPASTRFAASSRSEPRSFRRRTSAEEQALQLRPVRSLVSKRTSILPLQARHAKQSFPCLRPSHLRHRSELRSLGCRTASRSRSLELQPVRIGRAEAFPLPLPSLARGAGPLLVSEGGPGRSRSSSRDPVGSLYKQGDSHLLPNPPSASTVGNFPCGQFLPA